MTNPFASFHLWAGLFGGLALFLFGLDVVAQSLKSAAGDYMKDALSSLTRNRFVGMGMGALVTAILQSSSVTTVIIVGFVSAGLMSMAQSVSIIIGANIGTTLTVQILAFKVSELALPMIAVGFGVSFAAKRREWRQFGMLILGLGLVFYGMSLMSTALSPLRSHQPFVEFMGTLHNPLLAVTIGAVFTALVQSSAATIGIVIVLASQGLIALEPAIAITLGANIGTCATAGLASIGKPREAVRAMLVHTLFNVAGVAIWIWFIPELAQLATFISPSREELSGIHRLAAEAPRQIANAQTFFNVANALLFAGFTTQLARLMEWLVPDRPVQPEAALLPRYLDASLLDTPSIALETARLEIGRMGEHVCAMVSAIMPVAITGSRRDLERVAGMDKVVDALHIAIIDYLGKISVTHLSSRQSDELLRMAKIANDLENIGDRVATSIVTSAQKRIDEQVRVSTETAQVLTEYHALVDASLRDALKSVSERDPELAKKVRKTKKSFSDLSQHILQRGFGRLTAEEPNRLKTYAREMEVVEILDGVYIIARRIAASQLHSEDSQPKTEGEAVPG